MTNNSRLKSSSKEIKKLNKSSAELIGKWNKKYFLEIAIYIEEQKNVLESIKNNLVQFKEAQKNKTIKSRQYFPEKEQYEYHTYNLNQLKSIYTKLSSKNEARDFAAKVREGLEEDIQSLSLMQIEEYNAAYNNSEPGIKSYRLLQKTGNFFYYLRCVPAKTRNWIAGLFKKQEKQITPRKHKIYFRYIAEGYLLNQYISTIQRCTYEIQKKIILYARNLFESETNLIDLNYQFGDDIKIPEEFPEINDELKIVENFYPEYEKIFISLLEKSGTWEMPRFVIRYKLKHNLKQTYKTIDSSFKLWDSTFYAFYEDWRFRENLFAFISTLKIMASQTLRVFSGKLNSTLNPIIANKRTYIENIINRIPNPDNTNQKELKSFFNSELYKLHKETHKQTILEDLEKTNAEVEKVLKKLGSEARGALADLPDRSGVVRSPDYEKGINKSEIYFFSPTEFIEFECIPPFMNRYNTIYSDYTNKYNEIVHEFSDFDQITDFTLDTAISLVNTQSNPEQTVLMFKEGLSRSLNILSRVAELSNELIHAVEVELVQAFEGLYQNIKQLDSNDSILRIYSRLLKSKALEESKNKRRKIKNFINEFSSSVFSFLKKQTETTFNSYHELRKKLKIDKAPVTVSSEVSKYLADVNRRIFQLPVVYRYLFENSPVREKNLFLSRTSEIDLLNTALQSWKEGNFAATLITGENGSGKSSLLQNYLKNLKGSYKILYYPVNRFYNSESDFYKLMQDIFENDELTSDQKIMDLLNKSEKQLIVVVDGLERIFLRKPGGFNCLHKLLSLIVSTNEQVFWICAVSLYSYNYLDKTISIKENFDYLFELNRFTSDEIKGIILKRHRLSGYFVKYEDSIKENGQDKKIKQQDQLETDYFIELNKFAEGNISLSLSFWLESVSEFTENELYIKQFQPPDLSFIETLSAEKLYALLIIVLHGKITVKDYAFISNQSTDKSYRVLTILKEDSIIILKGEYYFLNGILYRHVIQLLKNKNLIH